MKTSITRWILERTRGSRRNGAGWCILLAAGMLAAPAAWGNSHTGHSALFTGDTRDYSLTVASAHGAPAPGVGTHAYAWHATVTASVNAVAGEYTCVGWAGAGSVPPEGGTTNTGAIVLTELASTITWLWEGGTVATPVFDPDGGQHPGSTLAVTVTCATAGATIHYTIDGEEPTEAAETVASGDAVDVPLPGTLKARAFRSAMNPSATRSASYARTERVIRLSGDLSFGSVPVAQRERRTLTIHNDGNSPLTVSGIVYPNPAFTGTWSGTLAPGGAQDVTVTFIPMAIQAYGGDLTVNSDKTDGTHTRACSGTGVAAHYTYTIAAGKATITGYVGPDGPVTIPDTLEGLPFTVIGNDAFRNQTGITSVAIPAGVTSIGNYVFYECAALTEIVVAPANPSYSSLDGVLFDKAATTLIQYPGGKQGPYTIPGGVTTVRFSSFRLSTGLTSVTIPANVTTIGSWAFQDCVALTSATINATGVIGASAFQGCTGLTSVTFGSGVTSIGQSAFQGCTALRDVTIPGNVTSIGISAFRDCTGLTGVTIGNGVTSIGSSAFRVCTGLTGVTIPASVTSIGSSVFLECRGLTDIHVIEQNPNYRDIDGVLFNKDSTTLIQYPVGRQGAYAIPASVTTIGASAFHGCSGLTGVTIPAGVTSIGSSAFQNCTGLTSVTIPAGVTSIESSVFSGCTGLTSVTIPDGVTSIGFSAFLGCTVLTDVTIPASVTSIGSWAFQNCTGLTNLAIPDSVISIGERAFWGCTSLKSVAIPDGVTSIGSSAFRGCTGLTGIHVGENNDNYRSIDGVLFDKDATTIIQYPGGRQGAYAIPDGVTSIGPSAFRECTGLTGVTIGNGVTNIGESAFSGCRNLTSVTISASVTNIEGWAFSGCNALTGVYFPGNAPTHGSWVFASSATIYYIPGTTGWPEVPEPWAGRPTAHWNGTYAAMPEFSPDGGAFTETTVSVTITCATEGAVIHYTVDGAEPTATSPSVASGEAVDMPVPGTLKAKAFKSGMAPSDTRGTHFARPGRAIRLSGNLGFGQVKVGAQGTRVLTIHNDGIEPLTVTGITYPYAVFSGDWSGTIASGGSRNVTVTFTPTAEEAYIGDLTVQSDKTEGNNTIACTGTGIGDYSYSVSGGNATITGYTGPGGEVVIPATLGGFPVTGIGHGTFQNRTDITGVTIPDGVTSIGSSAFSGCTGLKSVTIPTSVTSISWGAFQNCTGLTTVTIPASVTSIGDGPFRGCSGLTGIEVSEHNPIYRAIDGVLFNKAATTLIQYPGGRHGAYAVPAGVTSIGSSAFQGCAGLTSVTIPASVTSLGFSAFQDCTGLTGVYFEGHAPWHANTAFGNANNATIYYIPGTTGWPEVPDPWAGRPTAHWNGGQGTSFAQWLSDEGLSGEPADIFRQACPVRGLAYGFRYAFGTNLPPERPLLNIRMVNGRPVVETPAQEDATRPYVDVRVVGTDDLTSGDWTLPIAPAADTTGKPADADWHEPAGPPRDNMFFRLEAELQ